MTKLTPKICYMAGIFNKSSKRENNLVVVNTGIEELRDRFVEIAVKDLGVDPMKVIFDENGMGAGFYHSRIAKQLINITSRETYLFKKDNEFARSYLAGMFDIAGHLNNGTLEIRHINPADAIMLENLGIHSKGDKILNASKFMELIKKVSLMMGRIEDRRRKSEDII